MKKFVVILMIFGILAVEGVVYASEQIVVYSARKEHLIKPLFDEFTKETGINVVYTTDSAPVLLQKIMTEGEQTKADVLLTVDAGNLWYAATQGIFTEIKSDIINQNIPEHLRDPDGKWFGLTVRARTIIYDSRDVDVAELSSYEDLADPKWQGKLCLRTSKKVYNMSLVAMLIAEKGYDNTKKIVKGWVDNLAMKPTSSDTKAIEAILANKCDVAIINSYYLGGFIEKYGEIPVKIFWANQGDIGTHVNISGAGVIKYSKNKANAIKLIEWLSNVKAQSVFAKLNHEYPVNPNAEVSDLLKSWGIFKQNKTNVSLFGKLQSDAVRLMSEVGYE